MKNIHILKTDKPSRLYLTTKEYIFEKEYSLSTEECQNKHIYITNSEEIKERDWFLNTRSKAIGQHNGSKILLFKDDKKIILTTDQDLIKDGVQTIPDEFLEWFVKNPSCEVVEVDESPITSDPKGYKSFYKIIILKEEPNQDIIMELQKDPLLKDFDNQVNKKISFLKQKQKTLEESTLTPIENKLIEEAKIVWEEQHPNPIEMALFGFKWQQEQDNKLYSEEEVKEILRSYADWSINGDCTYYEWFEQFKKK